MADDLSWVPPGVDATRANVARVYDYLLGGTHNVRADRDLAHRIIEAEPNSRAIGQANRAFLGRAVRTLAAAGIRQFLDIGSGIPTQGNVHEIAQQAAADARVVYADIDPVAIAHSRAILAGHDSATIIEADLREPAAILGHEATRRMIDFSQPAGLMLVAVLHFIGDEDDPWQLVAALRDALAPGSYLVVSHGTHEGRPDVADAAEKVYQRSASASLHMRSRADILRFFDGFTLLEPGLVEIPYWRPGAADGVSAGDTRFWGGLVGVGVKP